MYMMNKLTLRTRITFLTGIIIIMIAILLTLSSISGANHYFAKTEMNKVIINDEEVQSPLETNENLNNLDVTVQVFEAQKKFATQSLIIMGVIIVLGIGLTYFIVGRALKPLTKLSGKIQDIHSRNLSTQIEVPYAKDEVGSLSQSFNAMLNRLDHSFTRQKEFAEQVAHELKTPLTTMKASMQVLHLDERPTTTDYKTNAQVIAESTDRLIHVVDGLLVLAFEGYTEFNDVCSSRTMFEKVSCELTHFANEHNSRIVILENDYQLQCNQRLLYQAIYNVVENAVKYSKNGGTVLLSAEKHKEKIILAIEDDGIGIDTNEIDALFDPFYRGHSVQDWKLGSGLGLPLVKKIVEKHAGHIHVESEKGTGTIVHITLPQPNQGTNEG